VKALAVLIRNEMDHGVSVSHTCVGRQAHVPAGRANVPVRGARTSDRRTSRLATGTHRHRTVDTRRNRTPRPDRPRARTDCIRTGKGGPAAARDHSHRRSHSRADTCWLHGPRTARTKTATRSRREPHSASHTGPRRSRLRMPRPRRTRRAHR
jgi:hypothetical protein